MDPHNRFHTHASFRLVRAEALVALAALCYLVAAFARDVHWGRFLLAFALIDLIGYIPGAIAHRRAAARTPGRVPVAIAPLYHHLYNVAHSFLTAAAILLLWFFLNGDVEWAMLALPIHLLGDRGLFGNTYKPTSLPFEPAPLPRPRAEGIASPSAQGV